MSTRALGALATLALAATTLTAVAVPATAAAPGDPRCQGRTPTIVGSGGIEGTPRDDVIVVTGRGRAVVTARGGDDTICLRHRGSVSVDAGAGDDRIVSLQRRGRPDVDLGPGDDTYVGTSGSDSVQDVDFGRRSTRPAGTDTIRTGGGVDHVVIGHRNRANPDTVDLGEVDDSLTVVGGPGHRRGTLTGGEGGDTLSVQAVTRSSLVVDAVAQSATVGGRPFVQWSSFDSYELVSLGPLSFQGTPGDDAVVIGTRGPVTASTGAGDDELTIFPIVGNPSGSVAAGEGRDSVSYSSRGDVVGDVTTGILRAGSGTLTMDSIEKLVATSSGDVDLTGSDGDDELWADGCHVTLRGGGGDDQLHAGLDSIDGVHIFGGGGDGPRCTMPSDQLLGEAGDDVMVRGDAAPHWLGRRTARRTSLLDGGDGRDVAIGGGIGLREGDRITCVAETRVGCED